MATLLASRGSEDPGNVPGMATRKQLRTSPARSHEAYVTYFLTFSSYGARLHGDQRGSVDRWHNTFGHHLAPTSSTRLDFVRGRMVQAPYVMDEQRRAVVLEAIVEHCHFRAWSLLAVHVRTSHVHVVVDAEVIPEKVLNALKAYASRALNRLECDGIERRRWARHGSTRYLWSKEDREAAIKYVADEQGGAMALYVNETRS